jgi:solute carrier family 25 citrate transporter 1
MAEQRRRKAGVASPSVKAAAGSVGGVAEACCLQPVDVVKTRLQLQTMGVKPGILPSFKRIAQEEGVSALWKGLTPFATHLCLKYMLRMGTNAFFQEALRRQDGSLPSSRRLASGFGAGITEALAVVTPFEVVKTRLQQQRGSSSLRYRGTFHCALLTARDEGPLALWSGAGPTVLRNGTNQMCLFYSKYAADFALWGKREGDGFSLAPHQSMVSGFTAACVGPFATGPFDVAKTRLMAYGSTYKHMFDVIWHVPREEGPLALWRGLLPRLMRIPPGQAITWACADQIIQAFEKRNSGVKDGEQAVLR